MPREPTPRVKAHSPVAVLKDRPRKKQGRVTIEDVEALVLWLLETHRFTPWFDTEAAASYLRREPGTLKGWRSKGEGPRFYVVNHQFIRYHVDDLDSFIRGGKRRKRAPKWLRARALDRTAEGSAPLSSPLDPAERK